LDAIRDCFGWLGLRLLITVKALLSPTALGVTGLVIDGQGRVLFVRHSYMTGWSLPGGGVDRGEPPEVAVLRELAEEVGLSGGLAVFSGLYTRRTGWATNVIALYRITGATVNFRPSWEVCGILWADPAQPPSGTDPGSLRRLAELQGRPVSPYW
jgi:8-oxo-dGTP pyrophosphatase MutT (NUDIX family)